MNRIRSECAMAAAKLEKALKVGSTFPENVFSAAWQDFLFFDPDWIFSSDFVDWLKPVFSLEGSSCVCFANLDSSLRTAPTPQVFFVNQNTSEEDFRSVLAGGKESIGWIHDMGRFGCTSDVSQWCIYCERSEEIAVIAFNSDVASARYRPHVERFGALPIFQAVNPGNLHAFQADKASRPWRQKLIREYGFRSI